MHFDWTLDIGTIVGVLGPLLTALWLGGRAFVRSVEKLGNTVTDLQTDMGELKQQMVKAGEEGRSLRGDCNLLGTRLTRIETLLEVMLPGVMGDPVTRGVFRDAIRAVAQRREDEGEPR